MQISEDRFFSMVATMAAGVLANPAHHGLLNDIYGQQSVISNITSNLRVTLEQAGTVIVPIVDQSKKDPFGTGIP